MVQNLLNRVFLIAALALVGCKSTDSSEPDDYEQSDVTDASDASTASDASDPSEDSCADAGDGYCDPALNTDSCAFDGGDCCESTCSGGEYDCGQNGYDCQDPNAAENSSDPSDSTDPSDQSDISDPTDQSDSSDPADATDMSDMTDASDLSDASDSSDDPQPDLPGRLEPCLADGSCQSGLTCIGRGGIPDSDTCYGSCANGALCQNGEVCLRDSFIWSEANEFCVPNLCQESAASPSLVGVGLAQEVENESDCSTDSGAGMCVGIGAFDYPSPLGDVEVGLCLGTGGDLWEGQECDPSLISSDSSERCEAGTVCIADKCRQPCQSAADCRAGGICSPAAFGQFDLGGFCEGGELATPLETLEIISLGGKTTLWGAEDNLQLSATLSSSLGASSSVDVEWEVEDESLVSVTPEGTVTGLTSIGSTQITAVYGEFRSAPFVVVVASLQADVTILESSSEPTLSATTGENQLVGQIVEVEVELEEPPQVGERIILTQGVELGGDVLSVTPLRDSMYLIELRTVGVFDLVDAIDIYEEVPLSNAKPILEDGLNDSVRMEQMEDGSVQFVFDDDTDWEPSETLNKSNDEREIEFLDGVVTCKAESSTIDVALKVKGATFDFKQLQTTMSLSSEEEDAGFSFRVKGPLIAKASLAFGASAAATGKVTCDIKLARVKVGVIAGAVFSLPIGFSTTFEFGLPLSSFELKRELEVVVGVDAGWESGGALMDVGITSTKLSEVNASAQTPLVNAVQSGDIGAFDYSYTFASFVGGDVSILAIPATRIKFLKVISGLKLSASAHVDNTSQIRNPDSATDAKVQWLAKVESPGLNDVRDWIKNNALVELPPAELEYLSEDLGTTPIASRLTVNGQTWANSGTSVSGQFSPEAAASDLMVEVELNPQSRDFLWIEDCVDGLILAVQPLTQRTTPSRSQFDSTEASLVAMTPSPGNANLYQATLPSSSLGESQSAFLGVLIDTCLPDWLVFGQVEAMSDSLRWVFLPLCGDGVIDNGEICDDGNIEDGDYCSSNCLEETTVCGDGQVQGQEVCDDGNEANGDYCSADCAEVTAVCGDGTVGETEACDDGNTLTESCDYGEETCEVCNAECQYQTMEGEFCGDGEVTGNEVCDQTFTDCTTLPGNFDGGFALCTDTCELDTSTCSRSEWHWSGNILDGWTYQCSEPGVGCRNSANNSIVGSSIWGQGVLGAGDLKIAPFNGEDGNIMNAMVRGGNAGSYELCRRGTANFETPQNFSITGGYRHFNTLNFVITEQTAESISGTWTSVLNEGESNEVNIQGQFYLTKEPGLFEKCSYDVSPPTYCEPDSCSPECVWETTGGACTP